jgi:hypothetical protein
MERNTGNHPAQEPASRTFQFGSVKEKNQPFQVLLEKLHGDTGMV